MLRPSVSSVVLDASALLALLRFELGSDVVAAALVRGAMMSTVNLSEVVAKLRERGVTEAETRAVIAPLRITTMEFTADYAYSAAFLRPLTRAAGLSFGDRACLALAQQLALPVITADRAWSGLSLGISITVIR